MTAPTDAPSDRPAEAGAVPPVLVTAARPKLKLRYVVAALVCLGAVAWLLVGGLLNNIVYLRPVSDAVARREAQGTKPFRMGGQVVAGSISSLTGGGTHFVMTDGKASAPVVLHEEPPDLFKDCAPVVVEGHWQGTTFDASRVLIRHGNEYTPPKVTHQAGTTTETCPAGSSG